MNFRLLTAAFTAMLATTSALAFEVPDHGPLHDKEFRHPDLWWGSAYRAVPSMPGEAARDMLPGLVRLGVHTENAYFDLRTGRWGTLILTRPLIPGPGVGNDLDWSGLGRQAPRNHAETRQAAWEAFRGFLAEYAADLRFDAAEFGEPVVSMHGERLIQIYLPRQFDGIPVRDSFVTAAINSGNLVLMGERNWADLALGPRPSVSSAQAGEILRAHLGELAAPRLREVPRLEIVPVSDQPDEDLLDTVGDGLDYRLVWVLLPVSGRDEIETWEALVDAHSGELLAFRDTTHYAERRVGGGVYPVSNDGQPPDGVEQSGWAMPFADIRLNGSPIGFATTGGNVPAGAETGTISTTLNGQYIRMNDNCGAINESAADGDLDLGDGPGTDCAVPPGASPGNTHASRSGFYELNRIKEQGRGYLPSNTWLQGQLQANMNINNNCNASWNGQVNFFTSGGGCANTGEIAAVFDHEWGHGMDNNDGAPFVSTPGEGIADIYAQNRLNDSCVGRGFRPDVNCTGFGDACLECTGVRESDWAKRQSGQPHDVAWIQSSCPGPGSGSSGPCGRSTHCEGNIVAEASWDLVHRDLRGFDGSGFNYDLNTALELGTRLAYYGSHTVGNWYQCVTNGTAGCNADGGYLNYLAANDDNGDLTDGTPHMSAIFAAFDRHQIACPTPTVQDSGCAGGPQAAPQNVTALLLDQGAQVSWEPVPDADEYWIFHTEGVHGCDFGKTRVGITTDTEFTVTGLRNETDAYFGVIAAGSGGACTSPMSDCLLAVGRTVGGQVQGIAGSGLVLQYNGEDILEVEADGPFTFPGFVLDGDEYSVTVAMQPVNPDQECTIEDGEGTVGDDDVTDVLVSCETLPIMAVTSPVLDFGEVHVFESRSLEFEVENIAPPPARVLELASIQVAAGETEFAVTGGDCEAGTVLEVGAVCVVQVTFMPEVTGELTGTLIAASADDQVSEVELNGTGVQDPGEIQFGPVALDFGAIALGGAGFAEVTISNVAHATAADIDFTQIAILTGGDAFELGEDGDCGAALAPQQSCTVPVHFTPADTVAYSGVLRIAANGQPTVNVTLSGNGIEPAPVVFEDRFEE